MVKTYNVNHYLPIVVCVKDVEAESMEEAIERSRKTAMAHAEHYVRFENGKPPAVHHAQFADGHLGALVDVANDEDFQASRFFGSEDARCFLPGRRENG